MGKQLYLEASSGISGDMFVASLLDLGADQKVLEKALSSIPARGFEIKISRVQKSGIDCCDFNVILDAEHENHDHDMAYLYGPAPVTMEHEHSHEHMHSHEHEHTHEHAEEHIHMHEHVHTHEEEHSHSPEHHHHHEHRHLSDVQAIIDATEMTESAKALANKIFLIVAEAESKAHHLPLEEVHFHEVGAIDSIVDIISAAVCFDNLGISEVIVPKLSEGTGTVRCQHGVLPVPVPATLNIVNAYDMPLEIMNAKGEYVTPTGAAIACALCTSHTLPSSFKVLKTGLGAGKRDYKEKTNILRAFLIETESGHYEKDEIVKLESDIDDASGEVLGYTMEKLFEAGALDVHYSPIYMKKNRPAWELVVICKEDQKEKLEDIIFSETTTIGIREFTSLMRSILHRETKEIDTPYGKAKVKEVTLPEGKRYYPEYEVVKTLAEKNGKPFQTVFNEILALAGK
ncbi:nickel pincer cofactor biosynthesis protein LarC [Dialister sp.]|uniref:nickel pincer cofactor biosynthesis protein LarC n=1 Tax=Dialister sp. TaxID=1955814 RepID=UPI002E7FEB14|nr:nickel pincer cofactor biosynthesis protein LarC [Dialister sp.]MEE3452830.1 nickel pincer cofactor biosynthesis protein LarC [Dialister sp.]